MHKMSATGTATDKSYDFLVSVISSAPYGILAMNREGEIIIANHHAREYLELPFEVGDLPGKKIPECIDHIPGLKSKLNKYLKNDRKPFNLEAISFSNKYLTIRGRIIHDGYMITVENLTRLKEIEATSLNSTFQGQEQERMRLAKEIHDGLGPLLSAVKHNLEAVFSDLKSNDNEESLKRLENAIRLVDTITGEIRNISRDLMPKVLSDFGLSEALENVCRRVDDPDKMHVNFYSTIPRTRFDKSVELGLFRIGQELINNALKHSHADMLNVQLIRHSESLLLMIEDNGRGFDDNALNIENQGIGLMNVESRTKALGGEFFIDSVEGKGVTATVEVPV